MNNNWQPIETAPTKGKILLFTPGRGVEVGYWYESELMWDRGWSSKKMQRSELPTHWMPLPTPPGV